LQDRLKHLKIDWTSGIERLFHFLNNFVGVAIKYFKVADSVAREKWSCHDTMEFPHVA
jgi:hypothetical protein